jgi:mono/diheme cytochrome c family protein
MKIFKYSITVSFLLFAFAVRPSAAQTDISGVELWAQNCGNCHTSQPGNRYNADWWDSIMDHMKLQARLTDAEADAILGFLKSSAHKVAEAEPTSPAIPAMAVHEVSSSLTSGPYPEEWLSRIDAKKDYESLCVACHGKQGKGNGPAAVAFNPKPANFTKKKFQESKTDAELIESLTNGKGAMPPFGGQLTSEQIEAMVVYIRGLSK